MDVTVLTDKQRQKVISKLGTQMSDNDIADKCGVSRSTVWRLRQEETARQAKMKRTQARLAREKSRIQTDEMRPAVKVARTLIVGSPPPEPSKKTLPTEVPVFSKPELPTAPMNVLPKVDVEPVSMANYFAVQILRGESVKDVAYAVMKAAEGAGVLFRKLQILDCISVGTSAFARFRSDLIDLASVLQTSERGFIAFVDGCYRVTFVDGRTGVKYPTTVICSVQKAGFGQSYAGPKIARWAHQFSRPN